MYKIPTLAAVALALTFGAARPAETQGFGDRLKKRAEEAAKRKTEDRVGQRAGEATDKVLDKAEGAVKCAATDQKCIDQAKADGKPVALTDEKGNVAGGGGSTASGGAAAKLKPGEGAWANFDFKPGERILFSDDLTRDEVGDFPRRWEFKGGNMEIVEWNGGRWLRAEGGELFIPLPETLPERFTLEFDLAGNGNAMAINFAGDVTGSNNVLQFGQHFAMLRSGEIDARGDFTPNTSEEPVRVSILVDGKYVKAYVNEKRVINVPNANMGRSNKIYMFVNGWSAETPRFITNLRIAAGGKKLYDALSEKGRVATQGIYFDSGSDRIRPESTPTLKEIAQMLKEHTDLTLTIEGHTDNVGNAATNQKLSEMRAEAVRQHLVSAYGVDASRLSAKGLGATKPVVGNDTAEGRQTNRRVELVKG